MNEKSGTDDFLWHLQRGDSPVIVNVPHAGTELPDEWKSHLTEQALCVPDTDWHVEKLYAPLVTPLDISFMWARQSRIVVDLNRDPSGTQLYPGASNTEVCPVTTFHEQPIYLEGRVPDAAAVDGRVSRYWRPYLTRLESEIARIKARHGYCVLLDGHSIVSEAPRFFAGRLPDLNLGTADLASCAPQLAETAFEVLARAPGFTAVHNGRFKGGYITRHFGQPEKGVHALQLEMAQSCYMDENNPRTFDVPRAAPLMNVLRTLLQALLAWQPPGVATRLGERSKT